MSELQPMTPPALEHVVKRCLAKDPEERWQNALDLALDLKWIADGGSQAGTLSPADAHHKNRRRLIWMTAAAVFRRFQLGALGRSDSVG
jgi:hypothetical protein